MYELVTLPEYTFQDKFTIVERTIEEKLDRKGKTTLTITVILQFVWSFYEKRFLGTEEDIKERAKEIEAFGFECTDMYMNWSAPTKLPEYVVEFKR